MQMPTAFAAWTTSPSGSTRRSLLTASSMAEDRGYVTVQLTRERVTANWHSSETIITRTPKLKDTHSMTAARGRRTFDAA